MRTSKRLVSLTNIFDPEIIVISGGLENGRMLLEPVANFLLESEGSTDLWQTSYWQIGRKSWSRRCRSTALSLGLTYGYGISKNRCTPSLCLCAN
jgi:hypothetical protein